MKELVIVEIVYGHVVAARELDEEPPVSAHPKAQTVRARVVPEGVSVEAAPETGAQFAGVRSSADGGQQGSDFRGVTRKNPRHVARLRQSLDAFVCKGDDHIVSKVSEMRRRNSPAGIPSPPR